MMSFAPQINNGAMSQKPIVMEQLKQILQLKNDGIAIREMARRIGIKTASLLEFGGF